MRSPLDRSVRLWHVLVVGLLVLVVTGGTAVLAAAGGAAFPSGTVRLASAWSNESISISGTDNPPVKVLGVAFSIPAGKTADVQATFSASLLHNAGTYAYCFGRITIDGATPNKAFRPGSYQLLGGKTDSLPNGITASMTGFRPNIGAGNHEVRVYVNSAYAGCTLQERALNLVINVR